MADEDAALTETIDHLGEASRRVRAARRLMPHRALADAPNCLRQEARPSKAQDVPAPPLGGTLQRKGRIPFDPHTDFDRISERALQFAPRAFGYGDVLRLVRGAKRTGTPKDRRGATYEQLARIAYLLGIDKHERNARKMWYRIARDVMLSEAHADHIIGGLKASGNPNREVSQ